MNWREEVDKKRGEEGKRCEEGRKVGRFELVEIAEVEGEFGDFQEDCQGLFPGCRHCLRRRRSQNQSRRCCRLYQL